jgi:hypothetical protein
VRGEGGGGKKIDLGLILTIREKHTQKKKKKKKKNLATFN